MERLSEFAKEHKLLFILFCFIIAPIIVLYIVYLITKPKYRSSEQVMSFSDWIFNLTFGMFYPYAKS
jgi:hypothetical protein